MTLPGTLVAVAVAVATLTITPGSAAAQCIGPTIEHHDQPIERDGTVQMIGSRWGDNCYDTGSPPEGEGVLGKPATGIEIVFVQQGVEYLVATGNADKDYTFEVDVPVPDELEPGPVEVVARSSSGDGIGVTMPGQMEVSERPATGANGDAPVSFGEAEPESTEATSSEGSAAGDDGDGLLVGAVVVAAVLLVAGLLTAAARRRRP